ncbi:hypothetical protein JNK13_04545 [bacterium]|nr:hypothetical protein [bacterium]
MNCRFQILLGYFFFSCFFPLGAFAEEQVEQSNIVRGYRTPEEKRRGPERAHELSPGLELALLLEAEYSGSWSELTEHCPVY